MDDNRHILNIRMSGEMSSWIDSLVLSNKYSSKSDAVRNLIRNYIKVRK